MFSRAVQLQEPGKTRGAEGRRLLPPAGREPALLHREADEAQFAAQDTRQMPQPSLLSARTAAATG